MKKVVRQALDSDFESLLQIIEPFLSPGFNWPEVLFRTEFDHADTWILEAGGEIQAFCCLRDAFDAWEISVLATRQSGQGQGYMQALLGEVFQRVGRGRQFWLEVHEGNVPAQKLYEKIGFKRDGARGGYYTDGSTAYLYSRAQQA